MIIRIIISTIILTFSICLNASNNIFDLPPFERAVCCIKFYEGMHGVKDYPYIGYGHRLNPGENYKPNMSFAEAELLLRKDLKGFCKMFRKYGKDSLLLATLAYNVGPYKILGLKGKYPKSELIKKIESGSRDFIREYMGFCHWNGKMNMNIQRRRKMEIILLYEQ